MVVEVVVDLPPLYHPFLLQLPSLTHDRLMHHQRCPLEEETVAWCREMLQHSPLAMRMIKASMNAADDGLCNRPAAATGDAHDPDSPAARSRCNRRNGLRHRRG